LARFGGTNDPVVAERMAKGCLILPVRGIDLKAVAHLADTAITEGQGHAYFPFFQFAKGLAEYRQGHYARAVECLQKVADTPGRDFRDAEAYLALAMAQMKSGKPAEARAALTRGEAIVASSMPSLENRDLGGSWTDWIIAHALKKEAQAVVGGQSPDRH
jgi:tetratricopeptide (TPR) repeat protein